MDPATIIGTTSAILSFIEFTGRVISTAKQICHDEHGCAEDNRNFDRVVQEFHNIFRNLRTSIKQPADRRATEDRVGADAEGQLLNVIGDCEDLGIKISTLLSKTKLTTNTDGGTKWSKKIQNWTFSSKLKTLPAKNSSASERTLLDVMKATILTVWNKSEVESLRQKWEQCILQFNIARLRCVPRCRPRAWHVHDR